MSAFIEQINKAKETNIEFSNMREPHYIEMYGSKTAYLLTNVIIAVGNIQKEYGNNKSFLKMLTAPNEKMKGELAFIAAVCEELLKE